MKLINNDYSKIIHFQREHMNIMKFDWKTWYNTDIYPKLKNKFMANDYKFTFKFPSFINKTYDELKNLKYPEKNKLLSSIVSHKKGKIYVKKVGADGFVAKFSPDELIKAVSDLLIEAKNSA